MSDGMKQAPLHKSPWSKRKLFYLPRRSPLYPKKSLRRSKEDSQEVSPPQVLEVDSVTIEAQAASPWEIAQRSSGATPILPIGACGNTRTSTSQDLAGIQGIEGQVMDTNSPSIIEGSRQLPEDVAPLEVSQPGGSKKHKQSHNKQKHGPGSKKGNNKGSDLIKDFFKDLAESNPSPKRSGSIPPIKGPSSKWARRA
ncbi:hypothetical protein QJS10_CPB14g01282 [Acorus calamus]|uniref:Uncharacterized protein n=1 Tax=Acorus calamus TaxID=4465 RepID=A0AAV9DAU7_ACOCL|nr:hypothetical protein QJS10_CPB14g01282 [Acorus calamus]